MWECGLKHLSMAVLPMPLLVTPHVGVWIETQKMSNVREGLAVTPHVGVWIETVVTTLAGCSSSVTPHVGVWIET